MEWSKYKERNKFIKTLRSTGLSIPAIAEKLQCSKAVVSYHCKNIRLTEEQLLNLKSRSACTQTHASTVMQERWAEFRNKAKNEAKLEWPNIRNDPLLLSLVAFFWAEGSKRLSKNLKSRMVEITNSDPGVLRICVEGFLKLGLDKNDLVLDVKIYEIKDESEIKLAWSIITNNINLYSVKKRSKCRTFSKYGVGHLRIKKSSYFYHKLMTWIDLWRNEYDIRENWQL